MAFRWCGNFNVITGGKLTERSEQLNNWCAHVKHGDQFVKKFYTFNTDNLPARGLKQCDPVEIF